MSDTVIRVENLSKKYIIRHQQAQQYTALRDVIADGVKSIGRRLSGAKQDSSMGSTQEEFWALKDVSFEVKQGDRIGIIGRNGAGKSTLLKILSRIIEPTEGEITLNGRVASLLEVGTGFHPELTGRENIYLNGAILGMTKSEIKRKFDEIIDFAEIEKFLDTPVKRYSSGMYVRLAFAVAVHLEPEIMIVDEVLAVGDVKFQEKCLGKMGEAAKEGKTVLFVSHDLEAIRRLSNIGILLKLGCLEFLGNISTTINSYLKEGVDTQTSYLIPKSNDEHVSVYAYKISVENEYGKPSIAIPVGKAWQIRLYLRVLKKVENLVIGIGFRTDIGTSLRTCWSNPQSLEPGEYEVLFIEEAVLFSPGNYSLTIGLSSYGIPLQYVENSGILKIADFSEINSFNLVRLTGCGVILNPLEIKFLKIN